MKNIVIKLYMEKCKKNIASRKSLISSTMKHLRLLSRLCALPSLSTFSAPVLSPIASPVSIKTSKSLCARVYCVTACEHTSGRLDCINAYDVRHSCESGVEFNRCSQALRAFWNRPCENRIRLTSVSRRFRQFNT